MSGKSRTHAYTHARSNHLHYIIYITFLVSRTNTTMVVVDWDFFSCGRIFNDSLPNDCSRWLRSRRLQSTQRAWDLSCQNMCVYLVDRGIFIIVLVIIDWSRRIFRIGEIEVYFCFVLKKHCKLYFFLFSVFIINFNFLKLSLECDLSPVFKRYYARYSHSIYILGLVCNYR